MTQFNVDCLNQHNYYRGLHGVPPLQLNQNLCNFAQEWANNLAARGVMQHRQNSGYGENIYNMWSSDPSHKVSGKDAVDAWYSEVKYHRYGVENFSYQTGHFTQVVWRDSKELGVGIARGNDGKVFVVANYSPPGNYQGRFTQNVPRRN